MRFSYEWLKNIVGGKASLNEMVDILNRFSFDTEPAGRTGIEVKIPPNRIGSASGHLGMAREIAAAMGKEIADPDATYPLARFKTGDFIEVSLKNNVLCRRYIALYAEIGKVKPSPIWLQKRIKDCGIRPINAVVDVMNYIMLESGQPLHAFDYGKFDSNRLGKNTKKQIIVRSAKKGEKIITIENKTYDLSGNELLICDSSNSQAIAGIKGGRVGEIDNQTRQIIIEAANFEPVGIRKTSRALGIRTDASVRFENGVDPNLAALAMRRAAALLHEICGAKIAASWVDVYPRKIGPRSLTISLPAMEKILGMKVPANRAEKIFKTFCVSCKKQSVGSYRLVVHTSRQDIVSREDVAEEIGRLIGYDKIPVISTGVLVKTPGQSKEIESKWQIQDELVKMGFDEVMNYSLLKDTDIEITRHWLSKDDYIKVTEPVSKEYEFLRRSLATGLLRNISENLKFFGKVKIFEVGHVFEKNKKSHPEETIQLSLAIAGNIDGKLQFKELKGCVENLFIGLGFRGVVLKKGRSENTREQLDIFLGPKYIGHIVNFWKDILDSYGLKTPVAYAEINLYDLIDSSGQKQYQPIPKYPSVYRDVSLFVPINTTVAEVDKTINSSASGLLVGAELFDVFEKGGRKSMSFHLEFRSPQKTLTDKEADREIEAIVEVFRSKGFEIR